MNQIIMYGSAIVSVVLIIVMMIKKMDIKITLFGIGTLLMYIALAMGNSIAIKDFAGTGMVWLDPLKAVMDQFKIVLPKAGFIILILGGYSAYMSAIGANDTTVQTLTKPIKRIKSVYILVPIVFLIGNMLSLVVPSASNLAIILLATLYPVLRQSGMSTLTAAAVIATTATIMPTPLGGDNVAMAAELAKYPEFAGLTVTDYVIRYHAIISVPAMLIMAAVHFFWQMFQDKKHPAEADSEIQSEEVAEIEGGILLKTVYTILPILPIVLLVVFYLMKVQLSVEVATLISFIAAIVCELIRKRNGAAVLKETEQFFKGMGNTIPIVALLVAAGVFVLGLNSIGMISSLKEMMLGMQGSGMGFVLPLVMVGLTILIVLLSGSGVALFYAMVPLMVPLAAAAGISPITLSIPMGLVGNLMRAVSPVSAVVCIVAGSAKVTPLEIVKRTAVPMIAGTIYTVVMSLVLFL